MCPGNSGIPGDERWFDRPGILPFTLDKLKKITLKF